MAYNFVERFLEAMDIISNANIENAGYDKTLMGKIVSVNEEEPHRYKVLIEGVEYDALGIAGYEVDNTVYLTRPSIDSTSTYQIIGAEWAHKEKGTVDPQTIDKLYPLKSGNVIEINEEIPVSTSMNLATNRDNFNKQCAGIVIEATINADFPDAFYKHPDMMKCDFGIRIKLPFYTSSSNTQSLQNPYPEFTLNTSHYTGYPWYQKGQMQKSITLITQPWLFASKGLVQGTFYLENYPAGLDAPTITFSNIKLYCVSDAKDEGEWYCATKDNIQPATPAVNEYGVPNHKNNIWTPNIQSSGFSADYPYLWNVEVLKIKENNTETYTTSIPQLYNQWGKEGRGVKQYISYYYKNTDPTVEPEEKGAPTLDDTKTGIILEGKEWKSSIEDLGTLAPGDVVWEKRFIEYSTPDAEGALFQEFPVAIIRSLGVSPYTFELDNDSVVIGTDSSGNISKEILKIFTQITATVFLGTSDITESCQFEWKVSSGYATLSAKEGQSVYLTSMSSDKVQVKVIGYRTKDDKNNDLQDREKIGIKYISIAKSPAGADAKGYALKISPNIINISKNIPITVTLTVQYAKGETVTALNYNQCQGHYLRIIPIVNEKEEDALTSLKYEINKTISSLDFKLIEYTDGSFKKEKINWDYESLGIVENGGFLHGFKQVMHYYLAYNNTITPSLSTSGWATTCPTILQSGEALYTYATIVTYAGDKQQSDVYQLYNNDTNEVIDGIVIEESYQTANNKIVASASAWTTVLTTVLSQINVKTPYLWNKSSVLVNGNQVSQLSRVIGEYDVTDETVNSKQTPEYLFVKSLDEEVTGDEDFVGALPTEFRKVQTNKWYEVGTAGQIIPSFIPYPSGYFGELTFVQDSGQSITDSTVYSYISSAGSDIQVFLAGTYKGESILHFALIPTYIATNEIFVKVVGYTANGETFVFYDAGVTSDIPYIVDSTTEWDIVFPDKGQFKDIQEGAWESASNAIRDFLNSISNFNKLYQEKKPAERIYRFQRLRTDTSTGSTTNTIYSKPELKESDARIVEWCSTEDTTYFDGGNIYAATVNTKQLKSDALRSYNYPVLDGTNNENGGATNETDYLNYNPAVEYYKTNADIFPAQGSFFDLQHGEIFTPGFKVYRESTIDNSDNWKAAFKGKVEAREGDIGGVAIGEIPLWTNFTTEKTTLQYTPSRTLITGELNTITGYVSQINITSALPEGTEISFTFEYPKVNQTIVSYTIVNTTIDQNQVKVTLEYRVSRTFTKLTGLGTQSAFIGSTSTGENLIVTDVLRGYKEKLTISQPVICPQIGYGGKNFIFDNLSSDTIQHYSLTLTKSNENLTYYDSVTLTATNSPSRAQQFAIAVTYKNGDVTQRTITLGIGNTSVSQQIGGELKSAIFRESGTNTLSLSTTSTDQSIGVTASLTPSSNGGVNLGAEDLYWQHIYGKFIHGTTIVAQSALKIPLTPAGGTTHTTTATLEAISNSEETVLLKLTTNNNKTYQVQLTKV